MMKTFLLYKRRWRANWRDSIVMLRQFRFPLLLFLIVLLAASWLYYHLSDLAGEPQPSSLATVYLVLGLIFFQSSGVFPSAWYLQVFYFLMPVIGLAILAQGVADFGVSFFNRRTRSKEWQMAIASTFKDHIILIGLGHLGYRVTLNLHDLGQEIVVVELNPTADLLENVQKLGIPVIQDDGSRRAALDAAGIRQARAILVCMQNDSLNLKIAVKARSLNPNIQVVARIFDDEFAQSLQDQFGFQAFSATGMAAPAFAAAAAGVDMTRPITVDGRSLSLVRVKLAPGSSLIGMTVSQVESSFEVSVVLLNRGSETDYHPAFDRKLITDDTLALLSEPSNLNKVVQASQPNR